MKHSSQYIQDFAKKLFHHKQRLRSAQLMSPKRDWLFGVLVGLLIIISMVGWSVYTYLDKRDAIDLSDTSVQAQIPIYRSDVVDDALGLFANREEMFLQLNQSSAPIVVEPVEIENNVSSSTSGTTTVSNSLETGNEPDVAAEVEDDQAVTPQLTPQGQSSETDENLGSPTLVD